MKAKQEREKKQTEKEIKSAQPTEDTDDNKDVVMENRNDASNDVNRENDDDNIQP